MYEALLSSLGENLITFIQSSKNNEVIKRLFIQECKYNLALLSTLDWKGNHKDFSKYIIVNLKSDISSLMLCHFKNDIFNFTKKELTELLRISSSSPDEGKDIIIQIVNKILILKVLADIPSDLSIYDKSNFNKRILNLKKSLNLIIDIVNKK
ncbi:MAG: hypothetical protein K9I82_16195 [Chitinophagaceae bacterium]|nr:hypothetical protein [Chitinophagaceae bacterium]